jgi:DNA topoisomerase-1
VCKVAAELLGNTPAVCRASYIDPRVIDQFMDGTTIASIANEVESRMNSSSGGHSSEELAVLALLRRGLEDRAAAA